MWVTSPCPCRVLYVPFQQSFVTQTIFYFCQNSTCIAKTPAWTNLKPPLQIIPISCISTTEAVVRPLLKKSDLDPVLKNFRPVSNLAFVGKAAEKAVIEQLINHCTTNQLLPVNQSSYRKYHSTETALVRVHNDILVSMDKQEVTFLVLLDLR